MVLPGIAVSMFLSLSVVLDWPAGQLYYGATSLEQTWRSVVESSLFELNANFVNPLLYPLPAALGPYLLAATGILAAGRVLLLFFPCSRLEGRRARWLAGFAAVLAAIFGITVTAHWLAFRFRGLLLPQERTALYFVPLLTVTVGAVAAIRPGEAAARLCRRLLLVSFWAVAVYFLLCLRLTYFKEWKWDADVREAYTVLTHYNQRYGIEFVCSNWRFSSALNYYRIRSGRETFRDFEALDRYPAGASGYVLYEPFESEFIQAQGLRVVYRGGSGIAVALRPSSITRAPGSSSLRETPCPHGSGRGAPDKPI